MKNNKTNQRDLKDMPGFEEARNKASDIYFDKYAPRDLKAKIEALELWGSITSPDGDRAVGDIQLSSSAVDQLLLLMQEECQQSYDRGYHSGYEKLRTRKHLNYDKERFEAQRNKLKSTNGGMDNGS